jgi:glycosyltransferase involved in cell wall biosynthesis
MPSRQRTSGSPPFFVGINTEITMLGGRSDWCAMLDAVSAVRPTTALDDARSRQAPRVSVVIPCLNEEETIEQCVTSAIRVLAENGIDGEVIVVDNASDDGSADLARRAGATVVVEHRRGYGSAYLTGFEHAAGDYVVMIDADLTYDFAEIPRFVAELDAGSELVMGNRMQGVQPGAMGLLSRLGNPLLSGFLNLLYRTPIGDAHCGMRAVRRDTLARLDLQSTGMEFASEMVIRASRSGVQMAEIPIRLHPRGGESKLSPFRDGWRHLRLMLVYNPTFLFLAPGAVLFGLGALIMLLVFAHVPILGRHLYIHTLLGGSLLVVVGAQVIGFGLCARAYGVYQLGDRDPWLQRMQSRFRLEHGLLAGAAVTLVGLVFEAVIVVKWVARGLGGLAEERLSVVAATLVIVGLQTFFTSFLLSIMGLRRRERRYDGGR